ncbi:uncharacterized protein [Lolium perenne]|uniref:uncharacterized protein n=1 Tax=Lolium perenne TaxID=4522 RepID=UPI0021F58D82|nr:uncharacterized protein LOC127329554 [Lolium perenne]
MQWCLRDQIGRNIHAYVDDIAVMSWKAAVSRFVSHLGKKALPLYKLLKKADNFVWDETADKALQELKRILSSAPVLAAPTPSEPMFLYLATSNKVISIVIVVERQEEEHEYGVQRPVYYVSEVLTESKQRYPHFQKLAYGVFLVSRKLRHYFQEHPMTVVSKAPLNTIINNSDATGRVAKWGIELAAFEINYKPRQPNAPAAELKTIPITWPFAVWGLDMVGKLKRASSGFEYLLVAVDKFSKCIEAKPVKKPDGASALNFVISLVVRFGIPHSIITDNGTNFAVAESKDYCDDVGIRLDLASVAHPQSNGQVEWANGLILSGIKPRLEAPLRRASGAWVEELPSVLWSLRMTPNRSTGFTLFFMVYEAKAILPTDIIHDSPRISAYSEEEADQDRHLSVDLLEEA